MNNRNQEIDFIRGWMILLVIVGHTLDFFLQKGQIQSTTVNWVYHFIYSFHMPVLFALSGYVCALQKRESSLGRHVWKLFCSLYIPYLLFQVIYGLERVLAEGWLGVTLDHTTEFSLSLLMRTLIKSENLSWFLLVLGFVRLISYGIHKYLKDSIAILVFGAMFWIGSLYVEGGLKSYLIWGIFFETGYFMRQAVAVEKLDTKVRLGVCLIAAQFLGLGLYRFVEHGRSVYDYYVKFLVGIPMFVILILTAKYFCKCKPICLCGKYSMVFYLVPGWIQYGVFYLMSRSCPALSGS